MTHATPWRGRWLLAAALLALGTGLRAQTHEVSTATELRAVPALNAKVLGRLAVGTPLDQTEAQGGWIKVQLDGQREGWVRLTHVKALGGAGTVARADTSNPITGLGGVFSGSSRRPTSTTGARGIGRQDVKTTAGAAQPQGTSAEEERLASAAPAPALVRQLDGHAATEAQLQQFARGGSLVAQPIEGYVQGGQP